MAFGICFGLANCSLACHGPRRGISTPEVCLETWLRTYSSSPSLRAKLDIEFEARWFLST